MSTTLKRLFVSVCLVLIGGVVALNVAFVAASPPTRTKAYFSVARAWHRHFPISRTENRPMRLTSVLLPYLGPARVEVEPHVSMLLDPRDYVPMRILVTGEWEPESWQAIAEHLSAGATFVDVGAHIGYYSLKAAKIVGPTGRVIAIEPNPGTLRTLRDNVQASGASVVMIQPVACSDSENTLELFAAPRANTGESSLSRVNASQEGAATSYRVRARPLDAIIQESGVSRVDYIKIDVEGAEFLVLKGAKNTLDRYHPRLIIELLEHQLKSMGTSVDEVTGFLRSHGYEPTHAIDDNTEFACASSTRQ